MDTLATLAWTLISLAGDTVDVRTFRHQPLIIHVWATWCQPCLTELRRLERWWQYETARNPGRTPRLLVVSPEPLVHVQEFVRKRRYNLPIHVEGSRMPAIYQLRTMPSTFFVDSTGTITHRLEGAQQWTVGSNHTLRHIPQRQPSPSFPPAH